MIKSLAVAALMSGLIAGVAFAQSTTQATPAPGQKLSVDKPAQVPIEMPAAKAAPAQSAAVAPETPDQCLKAASDLAQSAEERKLGEIQLDKIEDLLTKMESHCDAKQFVEAMAVGNDIKSLIETR